MSGGVDSSVAALLLKQEGYEVIGVTMRLWSVERSDAPPQSKRCCSVEDVEDARRVCDAIGARHYFMNFEREFQEHVVDYFVREYERGRTPHPCLACNDKMKFDFLLRRAPLSRRRLSLPRGTTPASGLGEVGGGFSRGIDARKDQSYVLFTLTQPELERLRLPIGEYQKETVRRIAAEAELPVAGKPDQPGYLFYTRRRLPEVRQRQDALSARGSSGHRRQYPRRAPGHSVLHNRTTQGSELEWHQRQPQVRSRHRRRVQHGHRRRRGGVAPDAALGLQG